MKTKTEIIIETVQYYSEDVSRRSLTLHGGCAYVGLKENMCAVGRCFNEEGLNKYCNSKTYFIPEMIPYIKEEYRIEDYNFWLDLQTLHDDNLHWSENGLRKEGEMYVKYLLDKYKD